MSYSYITLFFWHNSRVSMTWHFLKLVSSSSAHLDLGCRHEKEGKGNSPNEIAHWLMLKKRGVTQLGGVFFRCEELYETGL